LTQSEVTFTLLSSTLAPERSRPYVTGLPDPK
jgi:hypothetical protein